MYTIERQLQQVLNGQAKMVSNFPKPRPNACISANQGKYT